LWRKKGNDVQARGNALVAWNKICRPKKQGGLGVLNLEVQNNALLLKNLDKFFNHHDTPWVNLVWNSYYSNGNLPSNNLEGSFWWRSHLKLLDLYKAMAKCNVKNGKSVRLWTDLWQGECLQHSMPHLLSYAKKTDISVFEAFHSTYLEDLFHLPLSQQAYNEFVKLETICHQTLLADQGNSKDEWSYIWGNNTFSTKKAYNLMMGHQSTPDHFSWVWSSSCQAKHKFFFLVAIAG
jgi:hypothetical protein